VSYKKQELTILRGQMSSTWFIFFSFVWCPIMCIYVWVPCDVSYDFCIYVRFVFTSSCL